MTRQHAISEFLKANGYGKAELAPLAGDASFRRYIRLHQDGKSYMLMDAPPEKEDVRPYLAIARYLHKNGYSTPEILAQDEAQGFLLLEDLGDETFTRILKAAPENEALETQFYEAAIDLLAAWHQPQSLMRNRAGGLPLPIYDEALLLREVALLPNWYLPQVVGREQAAPARAEFMELWEKLLRREKLETQYFVHRDYHADNLMWVPGRADVARVGLLDFQDGVYGDAAYDLVSLLEDARRDVSPALAESMLKRYIAATGAEEEELRRHYALLGAQRNMKIVGIFVRLGARDGKTHYLNYLPRVWAHLEHDLQHPALAEIRQWVEKHIPQGARGIIAIAYDAQALQLSA